MRCGRAQMLMTAAVDGELASRHRRALDRHLAGCEACRVELGTTERMLHALEALPMEAAVPERLEAATLRAVRRLAVEAEERETTPWWRWRPLPTFAAVAVAVLLLAVGIVRRTGEMPAAVSVPTPAQKIARATPPVVAKPLRRALARNTTPPPAEPPPELAAAPDLFMDLPILRNMEKLQHFEAIKTTTLDDEAPNG
jgi:anti-sigma factor RsiW